MSKVYIAVLLAALGAACGSENLPTAPTSTIVPSIEMAPSPRSSAVALDWIGFSGQTGYVVFAPGPIDLGAGVLVSLKSFGIERPGYVCARPDFTLYVQLVRGCVFDTTKGG